MKRTYSASLKLLPDMFGDPHPCVPNTLSKPKLDLVYHETCPMMVGHQPNTRRMTVKLAPHHHEKLIKFLQLEGWLEPKTGDLCQLAQVHGVMFNAADFFPWAKEC
jgi:hypothetical protein